MSKLSKYTLSTFLCTTVIATGVCAQDTSPETKVLERIMVIGSAENAEDITGSAQYLGKEILEIHDYTSIDRVLQRVPGVNVQTEDGYGNRPNIGLRGGRSERSADITLMEDGILIAPAPYASPSAYYFPRLYRMEAVEVRKGSSTIKFGPRTTSGAINLVSSSIPQTEEAELLAGYGSYNTRRLEAHYGKAVGNFGFVIDAGNEATDGFKDLDKVDGDTGYSIQDVMAKFRVNTDPSHDIYQSLELKLGATNEVSDETYLGLSNADFDADPFSRYASTQQDNLTAKHRQIHLRHYIDLDVVDATTTVYHNKFSRNWYKLDDLTVNGTRSSLSDALEDPTYLSALKGDIDLDGSADNRLTLRANNRDYYATGVQTDLSTGFDMGNTFHTLEFGARYHYDKEDRFQQEDDYSIINGITALTSSGAPGSNANRHATAKATALYLLDEINWGNWTVVPGLRYEYIELERQDFNSGQTRDNTVSALMPGLGVAYAFTDDLAAFGGIHKGFAPPSPGSTNDQEEESINYEAGVRYNKNLFKAEIAGFFNDYSNLLGECTLSSGCTNAFDGQQFNAGEVDAYGLELSLGYDAAPFLNISNLSVPLLFNYTYTKAEFQNSFTSSFDEWGNVTSGDALPYIPEHQFFVSGGLVADKWAVHLSGNYVDEMRTQAGSGSIPAGEGTDSRFIVDAASEYEVVEGVRAFLNVENLTDTEYVAARRPAGARPGLPLTALVGVKLKF